MNKIQNKNLGGKGMHLELLLKGGFNIPETFYLEDIDKLKNHRKYIVRSSSSNEDGHSKTSAGKFLTLKGITRNNLEEAVNTVRAKYDSGNVVIQPDLSEEMTLSGVAYSNLNGNCIISCGKNNFVQKIVDGIKPETEITIANDKVSIVGETLSPQNIKLVYEKVLDIEKYFGIPIDVEFAIIDNNVTILQTRPLPNPTELALREHEKRRLNSKIKHIKNNGLDEFVMGVGNYREILANTKATHLSTSIFNYIFSGDGKNTLGAVQLGRNELGYDIGTEIFPWVVMLNGKVYYNFAGDALQFRPKGVDKEDLVKVINDFYLPIIRGTPDLLNYPELRLYIQFPEHAKTAGLNPEPYNTLADRNRQAIKSLNIPADPPKKIYAKKNLSIEEAISEINKSANDIRTGSAREYVKAARLAFFALEDVREYLENMQKSIPKEYDELTALFEKKDPTNLRDAIVYDESIGSFEVQEIEEYKYLGSFELSQPRGFPPERHFKKGKNILNTDLSTIVKNTRSVLEYREKVKFALFRDYDYLKQVVEQTGKLSGFDNEIYNLEFEELDQLVNTPPLASYKMEFRKQLKEKKLFADPIFESDLTQNIGRIYERKSQLIFGSLPKTELQITMGKDGYIVDSVDQTVTIPENTRVVLVPDNVRPGSHLFTVLSDYGLPVIGVPQEELEIIRTSGIKISTKDGYVNIERKK